MRQPEQGSRKIIQKISGHPFSDALLLWGGIFLIPGKDILIQLGEGLPAGYVDLFPKFLGHGKLSENDPFIHRRENPSGDVQAELGGEIS